VSRYSLLLIGVVVVCSPAAAAQDALSALDDYNVQASIIFQCHPSQSAADRAFLSKSDALRRAALTQLQSQLDRADPAHRADNAKKAAATLEERRAARDFDISEQARNYGCDWLDGRLNVLPR